MAIEFPWPEEEARVRRRVHGLVESVVHGRELESVRLEWVTPNAHRFDEPDAGWAALRLSVSAIGDESFQKEIWTPGRRWGEDVAWVDELDQLASDLEDWVCETRFAWGSQRRAEIPD